MARSLARTAAFGVLYLVATFAGRMTVLDPTNLSMVWPAAGVALVWFYAQRQARTWWADVVVLAAITMTVNMATGSSGLVALVFVVANVAQVAVLLRLFARWRLNLLDAGAGLRGPRDLWGLLGAVFAASACGAAIGSTGLWLATGHCSWSSTAVWLSRNVASMLLIGALGLRLGHEINKQRARHGSPAGWWRRAAARLAGTPGRRVAEYLALTACSVAVYVVGFAYDHGLPLAFPLIVVTVWAAVRLSTLYLVAHDLGVSAIAVLFTLNDVGPFAEIESHAARALVAQLFVTIVAIVGLALALGRDERERLMRELAAEKERDSRRADLLSTIIDSMADGLVVIEPDGRVVLRNPAAMHLLGGDTRLDDLTDASRYGLCRLDGTPADDHDLPIAHALAGEATQATDLMIRHPAIAEERIVSVTAAALPGGPGTRSAVVLFQDVTAERRHRDELVSFAGVVAHDLLNPLATVEGWTEATTDTLHEVPRHPAVTEAIANLARIARAGARMRVLINDLLAHTTARDATIAPVPVELGDLVGDIVAARVDAAAASGGLVPRCTLADLLAVHADQVLVRQLLDNLIGNAIKYVTPGVTPELTISSARQGDTVEVTVADNGIGIPAGQHAAIFGNFHRAHRTAGYPGTGLGLAICKRIVERHGGTITATDNPGGGSRFTFTLPAGHVETADRATAFAQWR